MKSQIQIFESGRADGIMSLNKKFYPESYSEDEIKERFLKTRIQLGKKYNFNGKKIFQAAQKTGTNKIDYPNGKYIVLKEENMQRDDFWYEKLPADILIISNEYKNIVVGNQMADCPVLIIEDRKLGVTALSHCGAAYIDRKLPYQTVEALIKEYNSNANDLYVYIGSNIKKESYVYDRYPIWATDKDVWQDCITEIPSGFSIDLDKAIINQLKSLGVTNIKVSPNNTATNEEYYSYSMASRGKEDKKGQNFVGFFYK